MNPFERRGAAYQRWQGERDKSALQERGFKDKERMKNQVRAERMPDERSLFVYFHPDAEHAEGPEIEKYARFRELGSNMRSRGPGYFESRHPEPKTREQICQNIFLCNTWDAEPLLLDDLEAAKQSGKPEDIDHVREMIRAASWMRNPRTDQTIALEVAKEIPGLEEAASAIEQLDCDGKTDNIVDGIEQRLAQEWKSFLDAYDKSPVEEWPEKKKVWPDLGVKLPKNLEAQAKTITKIRQIRDQIYYQRLYPQLCQLSWTKRK